MTRSFLFLPDRFYLSLLRFQIALATKPFPSLPARSFERSA
jgi:hypothetical protein